MHIGNLAVYHHVKNDVRLRIHSIFWFSCINRESPQLPPPSQKMENTAEVTLGEGEEEEQSGSVAR